MQDSHTPVAADETAADLGPPRLISKPAVGLPERLAGRLDEHLAAFVAHMRQGLLAASTAVGLEVMDELMAVEVTEVAGPRGKHNPARVARCGTASSPARSPSAGGALACAGPGLELESYRG